MPAIYLIAYTTFALFNSAIAKKGPPAIPCSIDS
jgi:hypothetical protein